MSDSIRDPPPDPGNPLHRLKWAYAQDTRNASAKSVLANLAWRDGTTEHAHPGNDLLASDCDLSVRSVHTALKSLVSGGFIVKIEQGRGLKATVYRLDYSIQPATIADRNSNPIGKSCKSNRQPLPPNKKRTRIEHPSTSPERLPAVLYGSDLCARRGS